VRADVEAAHVQGAAAPRRADQTVRHTPMRRTIARRLAASHAEIPAFALTADLDVGPIVALREALKARGTAVSLNDLVMFAVSRALTRHPEVNAQWGDDGITQRGSVDLGMAVALPTGLITPVLRGADRMTLAEMAAEARVLVEKAREGRLTPEEYTGNSFTVSNLGMLGIEQFTAIINPPASAILAVGTARREPVLTGDHVGVGQRMKVTMCCDHRVIDGAVGATFLKTLRDLIQTPALLWMDP
jgi:pyruvate dehydrogenase E2 component (dihydrolipoamide acetyltransferase)